MTKGVISDIEKLSANLARCIFESLDHTKITLQKIDELATVLLARKKPIESWTYQTKFQGVKVEIDQAGPASEREAKSAKDLFELEKRVFSFIPLLESINR